jgi:transmembrane sensor
MSDFSSYKFEDFIADPSFFNYAKGLEKRDIVLWEEWLASSPENRKVAEEAREFISQLIPNRRVLPERFIESEWNHLSQNLDLDSRKRLPASKPKKRLHFWHYAAACAVIVAFIGALVSKSIVNQSELVKEIEVVVPRGETRNILLPDNTVVFLNSDTKLSYNTSFGKKKREVSLAGEAFFNVTYKEGKPFIVNTPENIIKVLGTAFNVNTYPDENLHQISLERGKIEVSDQNKDYFALLPNQTYLLLRNSGSSKIFKTEHVEDYSSWSRGKIILRNQRFSDMARDLERSHNVVFDIQNERVLTSRYTGEFSREESIRKILDIIRLTSHFEFEIERDTIIIK